MSRRRFLRDSALSAASFAAPWAFGGRESECVAAAATDTVWELSLKNGRAENCHLSFAQVVAVGDGANGVECDSRRDRTAWHSCIVVPSGLIKAGQSVVVTVRYEIIERAATDSYFYVFARSNRLGLGADQWQTWGGEPGQTGTAKLRVTPSADDYSVTAGIANTGAIRILDMKIVRGTGWAEQSLSSTSATGASPLPTGAQPFTVEPPSNSQGPVVHLSNFGAVSDGALPPAAGPDRNFAALQAALEQCRMTKAAKLVVAKGVYRISSGKTIVFDGLDDFVFDGGGSTFLFHLIAGGAGVSIKNCQRTVISNFNLDWDWMIDPPAWVGRVTALAPDHSFFEMRFDTPAPLDPKVWVTMNPLDEALRAPGAGMEFGGFTPTKIEKLRHYTYEKHGITMDGNSHLSLRDVNIYSFPGIGFITGGDQHHFELIGCRVAPPAGERRPITTSADGFHVAQSQGFIRLERCEFGFMGDDCINIHDNIQMGVRRADDYTLVATQIVAWRCPFAAGDPVEIRNGDYSPSGFTAKLKSATADYKKNEISLVFAEKLPSHVPNDAILFNRRYGSRNVMITNCYFHENRARGVLCNGADWLIENNHFFHNQHSAMLMTTDVLPGLWSEGFGARNVIVRGNKFDTCNCKGTGVGAIVELGAAVRRGSTAYPLIDGIVFDKNDFTESPGPTLSATSFKNLVFSNNSVTNRKQLSTAEPMRGGIRVELGGGLWVDGNTWSTQAGFDTPKLFYDADTTRTIVSADNHLTS